MQFFTHTSTPADASLHARAQRLAWTVLVLACVLLVGSVAPAIGSSTSNTVVTATVPSVSWLDTAGCPSLTTNVTDLGLVPVSTSASTSSDCSIKFGANDTAALRVQQTDQYGTAMYRPNVGTLDVTFDGPAGGGNGKFRDSSIVDGGNPTDVEIQTNGAIVAGTPCHFGTYNYEFCISRYNADGTRDTAFDGPGGGGNGYFVEPIGAGGDNFEVLKVQGDGNIVAAGSCDSGGLNDFCLARYNGSDGSRDTAFDGPSGTGNGEFIEPIGASADEIYAMAIQTDGKIVVGGGCYSGATFDFCLARYNSDGSRDVTFDGPSGTGNGEFMEPVGTLDDVIKAMVLQPDGKILVSGYCEVAGPSKRVCLARYNADGSRDVAFDGPSGTGNGEFIDTFLGSGPEDSKDVVLQPDGKIVAGNTCYVGAAAFGFCLARYNADGSRDVAFDGPSGTGNGWFVTNVGLTTSRLETVRIDADLRIVATGMCDATGTSIDHCFARYEIDGSWDASFDGPSTPGNGRFNLPVEAGAVMDSPGDMEIAADGDILSVGNCMVVMSYANPCFARLDRTSVDDYADDGARDWDSAGPLDLFGACLRTVADGAIGGAGAWGVSGTCNRNDGDGTVWHGIPDVTSSRIAYTAGADIQGGASDPTVTLRFGMRTLQNQPPGVYYAPMTFSVVAPNAP